MSGDDPGLCGLRWCQETLGHNGPHRRTMLDTVVMNIRTGRPVALQANRQGESSRVESIALVVDTVEIALTWVQVRELGRVLEAAAIKWWPAS